MIRNKMEISGVSDGDILEVRRIKLNSSTTRQDVIALVLVKFRTKEIVQKIFKLMSKLARTGIFVLENLTKQRWDILNLASRKYGNKQVWSDQGRIYIRLASDAFSRHL